MRTTDILRKKMESMIAGIAGKPCEIAILGNGGVYLSIVMDGNQAIACDRLQKFFGARFDSYEYDQELDATYAGINLEK